MLLDHNYLQAFREIREVTDNQFNSFGIGRESILEEDIDQDRFYSLEMRVIPAIPRNAKAIDFFKLYINEDMIDALVAQTCMQSSILKRSMQLLGHTQWYMFGFQQIELRC